MHASMRRLYDAARTVSGGKIASQSELARALNTTPQVLNNWESRGVSQQGANKVQATLGISSTWVLTGEGSIDTAGPAKGASRAPAGLSHAARPDPGTMLRAYRFLVSAFELDEREFIIENEFDLFADAYGYFAEKSDVADSGNLVEFSRWQAARLSREAAQSHANTRRSPARKAHG